MSWGSRVLGPGVRPAPHSTCIDVECFPCSAYSHRKVNYGGSIVGSYRPSASPSSTPAAVSCGHSDYPGCSILVSACCIVMHWACIVCMPKQRVSNMESNEMNSTRISVDKLYILIVRDYNLLTAEQNFPLTRGSGIPRVAEASKWDTCA